MNSAVEGNTSLSDYFVMHVLPLRLRVATRIIEEEVLNISDVFRCQSFLQDTELSRLWLNSELEKLNDKAPEAKHYELPLRIRRTRTGYKSLGDRYEVLSEIPRHDRSYLEVLFVVYVTLRLEDAIKQHHTLYIIIPKQFCKAQKYLNNFNLEIYVTRNTVTRWLGRQSAYLFNINLYEDCSNSTVKREGLTLLYTLGYKYLEAWNRVSPIEVVTKSQDSICCVCLVHHLLFKDESCLKGNATKTHDPNFWIKSEWYGTFWDSYTLSKPLGIYLQTRLDIPLSNFRNINIEAENYIENNYDGPDTKSTYLKLYESLDGEWIMMLKVVSKNYRYLSKDEEFLHLTLSKKYIDLFVT